MTDAIERRHLRYVVALAEELHFGRAAERLGIAPPTLTVQIQQIETLMSARLFSRTNRSVALTDAGKAFLEEAREVLARFERAEIVGRRAGRGEIGRIEIGYVGSAVYAGVLQDQVGRFRAACPDVDLRVRELPMADVPVALVSGGLDVGFVRLPMDLPPGIERRVLAEDEFCLAVDVCHPLAAGDGPVKAAQLAGEPFIVPEQEIGTREFGRRGAFLPRIVASPGSLAAVLAQVSLGQGIAVVPDIVMTALCIPGVVFRRLEGTRLPSEVAAIYRSSEQSPPVRSLIRQIEGTAPTSSNPARRDPSRRGARAGTRPALRTSD